MNYSRGNCRKLSTFVLLNGDVPDVKTIYFVLIEQKKENCLQTLPDVLMITKHELTCTANKQLRKLVNVYVMLFIEIKNRKQKRNKRKKSLPFLPSFFRLLLKVGIFSTCKCIADLTLRALIGVHLRAFIVLRGYFSLGKTNGLTVKAAGSGVLLQVVLCKVRSWRVNLENWVGHEQNLYQAD